MKLKFTVLFLFCGLIALAQNPSQGNGGQRPAGSAGPGGQRNAAATLPTSGDGKITGEVLDSISKVPVEFATIALFRKNDLKKPIDGTVTDEKGKFVLKNVVNGILAVRISFIGYEDKWVFPKEITDKHLNVDLEKVDLGMKSNVLNEITVTGQKEMIEEKVDRMVYNAEKDIMAKGGDASDVLKKVPLLTVDLDGNVSLRGNSNIRVLINNKPSTIMAASIADALKQIPADEIKTVEVITSPSARYDAEGTGGIINIITKKNNIEGLNLNVNSGIGNRAANLGLNGSYRKGKFGLNLNGYGRGMYNPSETYMNQNTIRSGFTQNTTQTGKSKDLGAFGRYGLGFDYDIRKNEFLSGGVRYGTRNFVRNSDINIYNEINGIGTGYNRNIDSKDLSGTVDLNLDYLRIFKPQKELSFSTLFSRTGLTNNFDTENTYSAGEDPFYQRNKNNNTNNEFTVQGDFMTPIKERQLFEVGLKAIFRTVESSYNYFTGNAGGITFTLDPNRPGGALDYSQNVSAGYVSYTASSKNKWTLKLGTRFEQTNISATINKTTQADIPAYFNVVPSVNISKNFNNGLTIKTAYNRRIQRPGIQQLNPNLNISNPQSYSVGNPNLRPEISDNVELGISGNLKKTYLNFSLYSRTSSNAITQVSTPIDSLPQVILTSYQNIGKEQSYGGNLFGNFRITQSFSINGGFELYNMYLNGQTVGSDGISKPVTNSGWVVSGRLMGQYAMKSGWQFQAFSFVRGRRINLQGYQGGFGMYSLGISKEINKKKGTIGLSADNFLTRGIKNTSTIHSDLINQYNENLRLNRGFRFTFSYKIGKMGINSQPRKKTRGVNNTDVKEGGGNDNATQAPGAGGR